jgi:hypothetical protein
MNARDSHPFGFDMAYKPERPRRFGPALRTCLPAYGYLAVALLFVGFIVYGYQAAPGSFAYRYVVKAASERPISSAWFAVIVLVSGLAMVLRTHMRGITIHPEGIETLDLLTLGWPQIRRLEWPMIDRFQFDASQKSVAIDLWDGKREFLPEVSDREELVRALTVVAEARAIPYR